MLLKIRNLKTHYRITDGIVKAVDGVSVYVREDEVFGLAGESGCGKSTLIRTLMRLIPDTAIVTADEMSYRGQDLLSLSDKEYRDQILWRAISTYSCRKEAHDEKASFPRIHIYFSGSYDIFPFLFKGGGR